MNNSYIWCFRNTQTVLLDCIAQSIETAASIEVGIHAALTMGWAQLAVCTLSVLFMFCTMHNILRLRCAFYRLCKSI